MEDFQIRQGNQKDNIVVKMINDLRLEGVTMKITS